MFEDESYSIEEVIKDLENSEYMDYKQLVYLGKISDTYEIFGHTFKVHSPTSEDEIRIASFLSGYQDAITYTKAMYIECLAYVIDEVDGKPLAPPPLSEKDYDPIPYRREEISKWSPFIVSEIYNNVYLDLKEREKRVVEHVKKSHRVGKKEFFSDSQSKEGYSTERRIPHG